MKYIVFLLLLIGSIAHAQTKTKVNSGQFGQVIIYRDGAGSNSVLFTPRGCGAPAINMLPYMAAYRSSALYVDTCANKLYFYSPVLNTWSVVGPQNLQQVTDVGPSTTNQMLFLDGSANNLVRINDDPDVGNITVLNPAIPLQNTTLNAAAISTPLVLINNYTLSKTATLTPDNLTQSVSLHLPDTSGVLALSVNGNFADSKGNIAVSSVAQDLQSVTDVGDTTTNELISTSGLKLYSNIDGLLFSVVDDGGSPTITSFGTANFGSTVVAGIKIYNSDITLLGAVGYPWLDRARFYALPKIPFDSEISLRYLTASVGGIFADSTGDIPLDSLSITPSLTATQIAFGSILNTQTSSDSLTWASGVLNVNGGMNLLSGTSQLSVNTTQFSLGDYNSDGFAGINGDIAGKRIVMEVNEFAQTIELSTTGVAFGSYGIGAHTGTPTFLLADDAGGNIIEVALNTVTLDQVFQNQGLTPLTGTYYVDGGTTHDLVWQNFRSWQINSPDGLAPWFKVNPSLVTGFANVSLGDIETVKNGTELFIDDENSKILFRSVNINLQFAPATYSTGGYGTLGRNATTGNIEIIPTGSTGTVTSVASGNGMNFSTITGTGTVTMGTPSSITLSSTNSTSSTSHTHAFAPGGTTAQYIRGDGTLATTPLGSVTSVGFTGGIITVNTPTTTPAFVIAGTSGGIPYFSSTSTWASSALLAANAIMIGGGAGTAPSTTTTGTGVLTALGVNTGSAGAFLLNNGSGTSLTGVALLASANTFTANNIIQTTVTTGTGTTAGIQELHNNLTTGNGTDISSSSVTTGNIVKITSTSTAATSSTLTGLNVNLSGANGTVAQTVTGQTISVTNTNATSGTNVGINVTASGATTANYAALFTGRVGMGVAAPATALHVLATTEQLRLAYDASNYLSTTISSSGAVIFSATGGGAQFTFSQNVNFNGALLVGGGGTNTNSNLYSKGGTTTASTTQLLFASATNITSRLWERDNTNPTITAGNSYASHIIGQQAVTIAGSGTHGLFAQLVIKPLAVTTGLGTASATATLYVEDAAAAVSGAALNYAIWSDAGLNRFDGGIVGSATNDAATAGNIGEEINSTISTYTNYTTTATYQNITSITLTAGDWDISAFGTFNSNTATITAASNAIFVISTTTASAAGATEGQNIAYIPQAALIGTSKESTGITPYRVSLSATTTYYLNTQATFTIGNPQYTGSLRARRCR